MEVTALLTADHNRFRGLFTQFQSAQEAKDSEKMSEVAVKILDDLEAHTAVEEELFYPAVKEKSEELGEIVAEGVEEHHVADVLAAEIKTLPPGTEEWIAKVTVLIESVEHHAGEEEQEMFPQVRKAFAVEALNALGEQIDARKSELGAISLADKEGFTVEELRQLAQSQEIPGRSQMDREELMAAVAPPG